jgi:hypothetical protein
MANRFSFREYFHDTRSSDGAAINKWVEYEKFLEFLIVAGLFGLLGLYFFDLLLPLVFGSGAVCGSLIVMAYAAVFARHIRWTALFSMSVALVAFSTAVAYADRSLGQIIANGFSAVLLVIGVTALHTRKWI